jgi:hypothetical protein
LIERLAERDRDAHAHAHEEREHAEAGDEQDAEHACDVASVADGGYRTGARAAPVPLGAASALLFVQATNRRTRCARDASVRVRRGRPTATQ